MTNWWDIPRLIYFIDLIIDVKVVIEHFKLIFFEYISYIKDKKLIHSHNSFTFSNANLLKENKRYKTVHI